MGVRLGGLKEERRMYRITAMNPDGSQITIYDPAGTGPLPVLGPRSTEELNEAGSLEFSLVYGHEAWERLSPKKTYISAELDGREIFYGRVLNADPSPLTGQTQYTCAGALSFLQDSEVPPDPKKKDGTSDFKTMTAEAFFRRCIAAHNADIGNDPRRTFAVGVVNHSRKSEEREYQLSSFQDTKSTIDQQLISYYGGFLRTRRENGTLYIDWVEQYGDADQGVLELGRNIISLLHRMTGEDLYTSIRPIGNDGLTLSGSQTIDIFPSGEMAEYGKIVKSMSFPDATTEANLRSKAEALVNKIQKTMIVSSEISLVDMIFTDEDSHGVNLGDTYSHIVGLEGVVMTVGARNRDYENPQNDSCTLKNPKSFEGNVNGESRNSASSISKRSSRNSSGLGYSYKYIHEFQDRLELNAKEISINAEQLELHADMFVETANEFARISHVEGTMQEDLNTIMGTGVFQNSEHITNVAGQFQYDPVTHAVELVNGTEFKIHSQDGAMITVGTRLTDLTDDVASFKGSALWTQRSNITGVVGEFDVVTDPTTGSRTLVVKSGGGMKIRRDNTEFGLYDQGNLTGGIIVQKVNEGTLTLIRGDIIDLSSNSAFANLIIDKNGIQNTVRQQGEAIGMHTETINGVLNTVSTITGSALWTQRDGITGVTGQFEVVTDSSTGKRTLRVISGGGLKILRNNTEYGVYDNGSLTAGIICDKINGGTATIKAKNIILDGTTKVSDVFTVSSDRLRSSKPLVISYNGKDSIFTADSLATDTVHARTNLTIGGSFIIDQATVGAMIKTAETSGNVLTLTRFDGTTLDFSKATTLSGTWSGNTYTVTASPQNKDISVAIALRLNGSAQYSNFSAELGTYMSGGTFAKHGDSKYGYLIESSSGRYVDVSTAPQNGTTVARISTKNTYNAGVTAGKNAVTLSDPYASTLPRGQLSLSRTFYVDTVGRGTNLTASIPLHLYAGSFSSGSIMVYLKSGTASGSSGTTYAQYTVNMPTSVTIGTVKNSNNGDSYSYVATKKVNKSYSYNWLPITIGGKEYMIRIEF